MIKADTAGLEEITSLLRKMTLDGEDALLLLDRLQGEVGDYALTGLFPGSAPAAESLADARRALERANILAEELKGAVALAEAEYRADEKDIANEAERLASPPGVKEAS